MDGQRKLALAALDQRAATVPDLPVAEVTGVAVGAGTDGQDVVTVKYLGAYLQFSRLLTYTPVVGHVVALGRVGGNWTILGRPGGFPQPTGA